MSKEEETASLLALGEAIRARRLERGLKIAALARKAGMSAGHLATIERGQSNPRFPTLNALARALDIPRSILYSEAEAHTPAHQIAQRSIVLRLLDERHPHPWTRSELQRTSADIEPSILAVALHQLASSGVAVLDGEQIRASRCARRLDTLGMVSI